jgi:hypothetical protein
MLRHHRRRAQPHHRRTPSQRLEPRPAKDPLAANADLTRELRESERSFDEESALIDELIERWVDWREACLNVRESYRVWCAPSGSLPALTYANYADALDEEEIAAAAYAQVVIALSETVTGASVK